MKTGCGRKAGLWSFLLFFIAFFVFSIKAKAVGVVFFFSIIGAEK